jgi:hypothetical protein
MFARYLPFSPPFSLFRRNLVLGYLCNEPASIVVEIMVVDYPPHMGCEEMAC